MNFLNKENIPEKKKIKANQKMKIIKLDEILDKFKQKKTLLNDDLNIIDPKKYQSDHYTTTCTNTIIHEVSERIETECNIKTDKQIPYEYISEIYESLLQEETEMNNMYGYMKFQSDINERMRAVLIDWIIEVHYKFKLSQDTLFLCVHLIDKYLSLVAVERKNLQLIGVTALMIACKYEEIYSPELNDFIYVTDKEYTGQDILKLESQMLVLFKYDLTIPTSFEFFQIISQNLNFKDKDICLGKYLLELFMLDYRYNKYKPSLIAVSVCHLIMRTRKYENYLSIYDYLKYDKTSMKDCIRDICFIHEHIHETGIISVKRKYMSETFFQISSVKIFN